MDKREDVEEIEDVVFEDLLPGDAPLYDRIVAILAANREKDADIERLKGTNRELNRRNQTLQHSLNLEAGGPSWHRYFTAAMSIIRDSASVGGVKPEDAYKRGQENMRDVLSAALDMGGLTKLADVGKKIGAFPYVAPPTLPTEKE